MAHKNARLNIMKLKEEIHMIERHIRFLKKGPGTSISEAEQEERKLMLGKYADRRRAADRATLLYFIRAWHRNKLHARTALVKYTEGWSSKYKKVTFQDMSDVVAWVGGKRFEEFALTEASTETPVPSVQVESQPAA